MKNNIWFLSAPLLYLLLHFNAIAAQENSISRYDIIISEIMADPTPSVGLPAAEYIELHNRLPYPLHVKDLSLQIGNTVKSLPDISFDSAGYVIVIASKYLEYFSEYTPHLCPISSLSITDGGQRITLFDGNGYVIHSVQFKKNWHSEPIKQEGGWSLEMKDMDAPFLNKENWDSSIHDNGGTPGQTNSLQEKATDFESPTIKHLTLMDKMTLRIFFSETLCPQQPLVPTDFVIEPYLEITEISDVAPDFNALDIHLSSPPASNQTYHLSIIGNLCDCFHNAAELGTSIDFGIPHRPAQQDLVISEVLSHSKDGTSADFIEIFNRSPYIIDLKDVFIGSGGDTIPQKSVCIASEGWQLLPNEFCAICKDKALTIQQYYCPFPYRLQDNDSLPAFNNTSGIVHLTDRSLNCIDHFAYSEDMHYGKLLTTEGVSLERLSMERPTQDAANWHSASALAGFATPGYENSQRLSGQETEQDITISSAVISPDNDGFEDFADIDIQFTHPENRLSILIFNERGYCVKHLLNNELCGTSAHCRWDGDNDYGDILPSGIYILSFQWWNLNGHIQRKRKIISIY